MNFEEKKIKANNAKMELKYGQVTLEEAKELTKPYIEAVNEKSRELAKELGVRPRLVNVSSFLR